MKGPRIGRADVRAALAEVGSLGRPDPMTRFLARSARTAERHALGGLVEQITPLPRVLQDIAARVRRHCAAQRGQAKDAELAALLDVLDARASELSRAVWVLARPAATATGGC